MVRCSIVAGLFLWVSELASATTVISTKADTVSLTVFRNPERAASTIDLNDLGGFALLTEHRKISLPAGEVEVRFEGVAGGILPVSAIVTGLPGGVIEKNRDERLLNPAALVEGSYGKILHLKRTNHRTGIVTEEEAEIVGGPSGGVSVKTKSGVLTLGCTGLHETIRYPDIPKGLSAQPTLSVRTSSPHPAQVQVTLSYLANGFDWAASYVVHVDDVHHQLNLFAWATLANSNSESLHEAQTQMVAGRLDRDRVAQPLPPAQGPQLSLDCWPMQRTSDADEHRVLPPPEVDVRDRFEQIKVTAAKRSLSALALAEAPTVLRAQQEELGDLKLYRIPERVTVAAREQKQVALLDKHQVDYEDVYILKCTARPGNDEARPHPIGHVLRFRNSRKSGAGIALPSGDVTLFATASPALLMARTKMRDRAVDEVVELAAGSSTLVQWQRDQSAGIHRLTLTNAHDHPILAEILLHEARSGEVLNPTQSLGRKDGEPLWRVIVPAYAKVVLGYTLRGS